MCHRHPPNSVGMTEIDGIDLDLIRHRHPTISAETIERLGAELGIDYIQKDAAAIACHIEWIAPWCPEDGRLVSDPIEVITLHARLRERLTERIAVLLVPGLSWLGRNVFKLNSYDCVTWLGARIFSPNKQRKGSRTEAAETLSNENQLHLFAILPSEDSDECSVDLRSAELDELMPHLRVLGGVFANGEWLTQRYSSTDPNSKAEAYQKTIVSKLGRGRLDVTWYVVGENGHVRAIAAEISGTLLQNNCSCWEQTERMGRQANDPVLRGMAERELESQRGDTTVANVRAKLVEMAVSALARWDDCFDALKVAAAEFRQASKQCAIATSRNGQAQKRLNDAQRKWKDAQDALDQAGAYVSEKYWTSLNEKDRRALADELIKQEHLQIDLGHREWSENCSQRHSLGTWDFGKQTLNEFLTDVMWGQSYPLKAALTKVNDCRKGMVISRVAYSGDEIGSIDGDGVWQAGKQQFSNRQLRVGCVAKCQHVLGLNPKGEPRYCGYLLNEDNKHDLRTRTNIGEIETICSDRTEDGQHPAEVFDLDSSWWYFIDGTRDVRVMYRCYCSNSRCPRRNKPTSGKSLGPLYFLASGEVPHLEIKAQDQNSKTEIGGVIPCPRCGGAATWSLAENHTVAVWVKHPTNRTIGYSNDQSPSSIDFTDAQIQDVLDAVVGVCKQIRKDLNAELTQSTFDAQRTDFITKLLTLIDELDPLQKPKNSKTPSFRKFSSGTREFMRDELLERAAESAKGHLDISLSQLFVKMLKLKLTNLLLPELMELRPVIADEDIDS